MRSFWEVNQLRTTCGSWDIENWDFSKNWGPFSTKLALPVEKRKFFSINFNRNMYLLIILRGHWTLYEDWFTRYWIWHFCPFFHILPQKGNFRSSEGYILYQTLIETHYLRLFWGVNQLRTTSGSWDIRFSQFRPFWPKNGQFSQTDQGPINGHCIFWTFTLHINNIWSQTASTPKCTRDRTQLLGYIGSINVEKIWGKLDYFHQKRLIYHPNGWIASR